MAEQLIWNATVRANAGPQLTSSGVLDVDGYDKLTVVVPHDSALVVGLGPDSPGQIVCLVIVPEEERATLGYELDGAKIPLDKPHFLLGGAVDLIGNPARLKLVNGATVEDASVQILVGRRRRRLTEAAEPAGKAPDAPPADEEGAAGGKQEPPGEPAAGQHDGPPPQGAQEGGAPK